jgi:hypothetical protein
LRTAASELKTGAYAVLGAVQAGGWRKGKSKLRRTLILFTNDLS